MSYCPPALAQGLNDQPHSKVAVRQARRAHFDRERLEKLFDSMQLVELFPIALS